MKRVQVCISGLLVILAVSTAAQREESQPVPPRQALERAEDAAIREVLDASRSDSAELRANAIEAMSPRPRRLLPLAQLGMEDANPAVRFTALVAIGEGNLDALGHAAAAMTQDTDPSVRAAAVFAADACGVNVDMNELPQMLMSTDPSVRGNAAMLLGMMDDPSAIPMLRDAAKQPMPRTETLRRSLVNLQIAEAMVKLGAEGEIEPIRAAMWAQEYELRVMAVLMLGELRDRRMIPAFENLLRDQPIELRLAAAEALARMGDDRGLPVMLVASGMDGPAIADQAEDFIKENRDSPLVPAYRQMLTDRAQQEQVAARARAQAAFALAQVNDAMAAEALVGLLEDPSPRVRLAAAAAILRALAPDEG